MWSVGSVSGRWIQTSLIGWSLNTSGWDGIWLPAPGKDGTINHWWQQIINADQLETIGLVCHLQSSTEDTGTSYLQSTRLRKGFLYHQTIHSQCSSSEHGAFSVAITMKSKACVVGGFQVGTVYISLSKTSFLCLMRISPCRPRSQSQSLQLFSLLLYTPITHLWSAANL